VNIFICEPKDFSDKALNALNQVGTVIQATVPGQLEHEDLARVNVLWVRLARYIDKVLLERLPELEIIVSPTTGLNHIDLRVTESKNIRVFSLRGEVEFLRTVRATAEYTIGLALALIRKIPKAAASVHTYNWDRDSFRGQEIYGKTIGIIGYGRLGRIVARYFRTFGSRVLVCDIRDKNLSLEDGVEWASQEYLLTESDLVSIHVDLNSSTNQFFGRNCFSLMKDGALLVNTARGELIDEDALLDALREGSIAGAAVDVLKDEHLLGNRMHPLIEYASRSDNLIVTPHIGGCTLESMLKTEEFLAEKLCVELLSR